MSSLSLNPNINKTQTDTHTAHSTQITHTHTHTQTWERGLSHANKTSADDIGYPMHCTGYSQGYSTNQIRSDPRKLGSQQPTPSGGRGAPSPRPDLGGLAKINLNLCTD